MVRTRLDAWFGGYRAALGSRDLRLLLGGLVVSASGSWAYNVALLAFVYDKTGSLGWVGAASLVRFIPALLFSTYGGVLAERVERVRLMVLSDLICALWMLGLVAVAAADGPVVLALLLAGLTAVTNVVYNPAVSATIPSVVDEDHLVAANAMNGTIENLVVILGPALGAVLLLLGSPAAVFAVNAASFGVSALMVIRMRARSRPVDVTDGGDAGPLRQMIVGFQTIAADHAARTLVAFCALVSFVYGTDTVLFVGVSEQHLGTGTEGFGYLLVGLGLGGVLGAGLVDRLAGSSRLAVIIIAGVAGYCLPTALLTVVESPAIAFVIQVFRGGSTLVVDVLAVTALQRAVPSDRLARVFGVFFAFVLGAISLGALITPPIVSASSLDTGLVVMAVGPFALGLLGFPALLAIDRATAARAAELAPRVAVFERLGLFASATRPVLERLAGLAVEERFPAGTAVVREGDEADALFVLLEGEVEVTSRGEAGEAERVLRTMTAPTYFGEIGVLEKIPRTATVTALTDCRCELIEGEALLEALATAPPSTSLMENARTRLALTHPSRRFTAADGSAASTGP
jgi:predicted MFS family arabinose efflux permease